MRAKDPNVSCCLQLQALEGMTRFQSMTHQKVKIMSGKRVICVMPLTKQPKRVIEIHDA